MYFGNPVLSNFQARKKVAANTPSIGESGDYTKEMFREDHPEFYQVQEGGQEENSLLPPSMLEIFLMQTNESVLPSRWGSLWRLAAGLCVSHFAALYLKTYQEGSASAGAAAVNAAPTGLVSSAKMGDTSVSYDNSAVTEGTKEWGTWNATVYGQQLITYARSIGMGGMYVI